MDSLDDIILVLLEQRLCHTESGWTLLQSKLGSPRSMLYRSRTGMSAQTIIVKDGAIVCTLGMERIRFELCDPGCIDAVVAYAERSASMAAFMAELIERRQARPQP